MKNSKTIKYCITSILLAFILMFSSLSVVLASPNEASLKVIEDELIVADDFYDNDEFMPGDENIPDEGYIQDGELLPEDNFDRSNSVAASAVNTMPIAPIIPGASNITSTSITISWFPVPGAVGYILYRNGTEIYKGTATRFTDTGLTPNTIYTYTLRAYNSAGIMSVVGQITAKTQPAIPTAPTNFIASPGDRQVALKWSAPANNSISAIMSYEVSRDSGSTWVSVGLNTSYTFTGLTNGTAYTFRVRAVNAAGAGAQASVSASPKAPVTVPGAPMGLTAIPGNKNVMLRWSQPSNNGGAAIVRYEVSQNGGATWANVGLNTSMNILGLVNGTPYTFRVRAVNVAGPGASAMVTATPR